MGKGRRMAYTFRTPGEHTLKLLSFNYIHFLNMWKESVIVVDGAPRPHQQGLTKLGHRLLLIFCFLWDAITLSFVRFIFYTNLVNHIIKKIAIFAKHMLSETSRFIPIYNLQRLQEKKPLDIDNTWTQDKVKVTNLKKLPNIQILELSENVIRHKFIEVARWYV